MDITFETLFFFVFCALMVAIGAFVFSNILTGNGEVFGGLYGLLDRVFKTDERASQGKGIHPLFKMLMQCEKCVAGQWALWSFMIVNWNLYSRGYLILIFVHLAFIFLSIFLTLVVKAFYIKHIKPTYGS
jgi:hypothetical protein